MVIETVYLSVIHQKKIVYIDYFYYLNFFLVQLIHCHQVFYFATSSENPTYISFSSTLYDLPDCSQLLSFLVFLVHSPFWLTIGWSNIYITSLLRHYAMYFYTFLAFHPSHVSTISYPVRTQNVLHYSSRSHLYITIIFLSLYCSVRLRSKCKWYSRCLRFLMFTKYSVVY